MDSVWEDPFAFPECGHREAGFAGGGAALNRRDDSSLDELGACALARGVGTNMTIAVACALIERDGKVLAAKRPVAKAQGGKWEFPGGKLDEGESARDALVREIAEELRVAIVTGDALPLSTHDYGPFAITLHPFRCSIASGEPDPVEHEAIVWLAPAELAGLDWAAADVPVMNSFLSLFAGEGGAR